jgi:hypothetical protein
MDDGVGVVRPRHVMVMSLVLAGDYGGEGRVVVAGGEMSGERRSSRRWLVPDEQSWNVMEGWCGRRR